jgi:hypothetical protein
MKTFSKILCTFFSLLVIGFSIFTFWGLHNDRKGSMGSAIASAKESIIKLKSSSENLNKLKNSESSAVAKSSVRLASSLPATIDKAEKVIRFFSIFNYLLLIAIILGLFGLVAPFAGSLKPAQVYAAIAFLLVGVTILAINPSQKDHAEVIRKSGYIIAMMNAVFLMLGGLSLLLIHKFNKA